MRLLALLLIPALAPAQVAKFRVKESAGLRRFNFPVRVSVRADTTALALFENGKPAPAQFTAASGGMVEIDFNSSPAPWEAIEYRVERGSSAPFASNVSVGESNGAFLVRAGLEYTVPDNLLGFFRQVSNARVSYLRPGSQGLVLNYRDDAAGYRVGAIGEGGAATKATITKRGPLVAALRFESMEAHNVKSVVEMDFPRSKSWVEVRWTLNDRSVTAMVADLNLLIEGAGAVVDFGANNTVYAALKPGQRATLAASIPQPEIPLWFVHLNGDLYASGKRAFAEGWAHIMDPQRATAVAVDAFGRDSNDRIEVSADGRLVIRRDAQRGSDKYLRFWLHFVGMPVQLGAATSPQAILSPLRIEWE